MNSEQLSRSLFSELNYQWQRLMAQQAGLFQWCIENNGRINVTESHRKVIRRSNQIGELLDLLRE